MDIAERDMTVAAAVLAACQRAVSKARSLDNINLDAVIHGLKLSPPAPAKSPRILVIVYGGIADYVCDMGVNVEVFDWDNYNDDPEGTGGVRSEFADLATPCGIPVNQLDTAIAASPA